MPISILSRIKGKSLGMGSSDPNKVVYDPAAGTQVVKGMLSVTTPTTVKLDPSIFNVRGTFTLFTYGSLYVQPGLTAQQQLNQYLWISQSLLTGVSVLDIHGTIDEANKKITVTIV